MSDDIFIKQDQVIGQQPFISQTAVSGQAYTTSQRVYQVPSIGQTPFTYVNRTPTITQTALNVQNPSTYQHRSPLTYQHRSPSTYNHRSPFTYNHRSPFTYNARQPANYQHQSPSTYQVSYSRRESSNYDHRSPFITQVSRSAQEPNITQTRTPLIYQHQSTFTYDHRSPLTYDHRSPVISQSTYNHREPIIYQSRTSVQSSFTYQHRSPFTYDHREPSTYNHRSSFQSPLIYQHQSPATYNHRSSFQSPFTYDHRSPLTYDHRSPFIYQNTASKQTTVTYNHRSPLTYDHRSPLTYDHRSPFTYDHRSPLTYDHRSPLTYNHRSPFTYSRRTPFIFDGVDGDDAGDNSTTWGPGDSSAIAYVSASDVTSNRLWDTTVNSSSASGAHNANCQMIFNYQTTGSNANTLRARWHMDKSAQSTQISRYEDFIQSHSPSGIDSSWSWDVKWETTTASPGYFTSNNNGIGTGPSLAEDTYHNVWNGTTATQRLFKWEGSTSNQAEAEVNVISANVKFTVRISKSGETSLFTSTTAQSVSVFVLNTGGGGGP